MKREYQLSSHHFKSPKFLSVVGEAIKFFKSTPVVPLPPETRFIGAGVYALYYRGSCKHYLHLSKQNRKKCNLPIYVGKAVPPGWRTGRKITVQTADLYRRLCEHSKSIRSAKGLNVRDFKCQFVVLSGIESDLVVPIEAALIRKFMPLWNTCVDGFGNHDPGKGRYNQAVSEWDILHPGRTWAKRLKGLSPKKPDILKKIAHRIETV